MAKNIISVLRSILAALMGVQSSRYAEEDLKKGNFILYAVIGTVTVLVIIGVLLLVVQHVVP